VEAGRAVDVELEGSRGVVLRGRIVDETGAAIAGARVGGVSQALSLGIRPSDKSDADGSFEIAGIYPGRVSVNAHAEGMKNAWLELGRLADGQVREGLELVLIRIRR
jgi:hypothetical protein